MENKSLNKKVKIFLENDSKNYFDKIKLLFLLFIIILFLVLNLYPKQNNSLLLKKAFKVLQNEKEINLYFKNKTDFYFQKRLKFLNDFGFKYNESNLKTFQEKLNYLMIHESPEYKADIVDKIKIHEYSKKVLGKDICPPILKIYDNVSEININELPDKFVLKCNHGSGMNIICKDKKNFNLENAKSKLNNWMNINYGLNTREFQYIFIEKKIFAAQYLIDNIIDYEVYCFNGKPKFVRVHKLLDERSHVTLHNYYDLNWNLTDIETGLNHYIRDPNIKIEKPNNLNLMLDYAIKLTKDFVFVRVDFYEINNTVFLSELTFTPSNCLNKFKNEEQRLYLGNLLDITKIKKSLFNK